MRAFPDLPVVYLFEETGKDVFIIVGIDHRIDKPEFVIGRDLRVITVAVDKTTVLVLRARENEVIAAESAVCRLKHLCQ